MPCTTADYEMKNCTFSSLEKNIIAGTMLCIPAACYPDSIAGGCSAQNTAHLDSWPVGDFAYVQASLEQDTQNPVSLTEAATEQIAVEVGEQTVTQPVPAGLHTDPAVPHGFAAGQHELCGLQPRTAAWLPVGLDGHM